MLREALHRFAGTRPLRVIEAEILDDAGRKIGEGPLFERYFLCEIPRCVPVFGGGAVYLHHYLRSDPDRGVHDHPWDHALAVQLCGGYVEERFAGVSAEGMRKSYKSRKPWRGYSLKGSDFHRVLIAGGGATSWSLFLHGPYRKGWGMLSDAGSWQRIDAAPSAGLIFRPVVEASSGRGKWWRDRQKHPPGRDQARADAWGQLTPKPAPAPGDVERAARLAVDVQ